MSSKKPTIILIFLVLFLVILFGFLLPCYNKIRSNQKEIEKLDQGVEKLSILVEQTDKLKDEKMLKKIDELFSALPKEKDIPVLLSQFNSLASSNGLILGSVGFYEISPKNKRKKEKEKLSDSKFLNIIAVNLEVSGSYGSFKNFLHSLEKNVRAMNIKSISFHSDKDMGDVFDFKLVIEAYYKP